MTLDGIEKVLSVLALAGAIWAARFLLPKAVREHDRFGEIVALLTAVGGLLTWLFLGIGARS